MNHPSHHTSRSNAGLLDLEHEIAAATNARPQTLPAIIENIPHDILYSAQLVNWRWDRRDDTWTKLPVNPYNGSNASVTNPRTWGDHTQVIKRLTLKTTAGIGYVLTDKNNHFAVDIDHCVHPETRAIEPRAQAIIDTLNTYTEFTPSGTGVRCYGAANLPFAGKRKGQVEIYTSKRFVTITGQRVPGTPATIEDRQTEIETLVAELWPAKPKPSSPAPAISFGGRVSDQKLLEKAFNARNGSEFRRLWDGDTSDYAGDHSRADFALCQSLLFWSGGDRSWVDALFRQSGLTRNKWDERRGALTYGEQTILQADATMINYYRWERAKPNDPGRTKMAVPEDPPIQAITEALESLTKEEIQQRLVRLERDFAHFREAAETRRAELEKEFHQVRSENERLRAGQSAVFEAFRNPNIKAEKFTAAAVAFEMASAKERGLADDNGFVAIPLERIAEKAGVTAKTASRHIERLQAWGLCKRHTTLEPTKGKVDPKTGRIVDPETGEILPPFVSKTYIGDVNDPLEFFRALRDINPEKPQWGGQRTPVRCEDHPDADLIVTTITECSECGEEIPGTRKLHARRPERVETTTDLTESPRVSQDGHSENGGGNERAPSHSRNGHLVLSNQRVVNDSRGTKMAVPEPSRVGARKTPLDEWGEVDE